jgi:ribosome-binding factor A
MSRRTEMLGSTIQRELAVMILRDLQDPRLTGLPSITKVKVSPDLSAADVYVTIMGTPGQQSAALNALRHSAGLMRSKLTKALTLRVAPYIKFHIDENLKKEIEVLDRRRAEAAALAGGASGEIGDRSDGETGDECSGEAGDAPQGGAVGKPEDQAEGQAESDVAAAASQASEDNQSQ